MANDLPDWSNNAITPSNLLYSNTDITTDPFSTTVTLPVTCRTLVAVVPFADTLSPDGPSLSVVGGTTGITYTDTSNTVVSKFRQIKGTWALFTVPVCQAVDATVAVTLSATGASGPTPSTMYIGADLASMDMLRFQGVSAIANASGEGLAAAHSLSTATQTMLGAPIAGTAHVLNRFVSSSGVSGQLVQLILHTSGAPLGVAKGNIQGPSDYDRLNNIIVTDQLDIVPSSADNIYLYLYYSTISI